MAVQYAARPDRIIARRAARSLASKTNKPFWETNMQRRIFSAPAKSRLYRSASACALLTAISVPAAHAQPVPSPLSQYAQDAYDHGITFNSGYNGEFATNPSGGERQGAEYTGQISLGIDFDLAKLAGLQGGTIHVQFTDRAGNNLAAKSINNSVSVQQIYGDGQTYQLSLLSYEQSLFNNALDITVGRVDIASTFLISPFYCDFQTNATCGNPSFLGKDANIGSSYNPVPVWGGHAQVNFTPNIYAKAGIYQGAPNINPDKNHGFDWSTNHSDGFQTAGEIGYQTTAPGAAEPDQYDAGVQVDRTHYSAPYYDSAAPQQYGRSIAYVQAQKMVFQPIANSPQGLYLFAVGMVGLNGSKQPSNFSAEAGAVYQGIIPSRPEDYAGLLVNDVHYNNTFLNSLYAQRVAEGGTQRPASNLIMMELNYTAQLTPWLNVTPNLQYVINPDGLGGLAYPTKNLKNAFVVGLQFQVDVADLLGLSIKPPAPAAMPMAQPAPATAPAMAPAPIAAATYLVFFDWDKSSLTPRADAIIAQAAAGSQSKPVTTITVSGYTDTSGTPDYNQGLSERRADAVAAQLVSDGVSRSEIEIHAFGETHLLVPTGPGVREPQNRRVEIVLQ
jgi:porin